MSRTIYVDVSAPSGGTHDGSSWTAAYANVPAALTAATSGDEIHVADGTYKPSTSTDRTASFQLKSGVKLFGGYAGYGSASPDARNFTQYVSTLSGDLGVSNNVSDNSYHVVTASGAAATSVLDGFTVSGGNANGSTDSTSSGGGLYAAAGSPTVNQCIFATNTTTNVGGAMYFDATSAPTITGCSFSGNSATGNLPAGGAISFSKGSISGCSFTGNSIFSSQGRGGGALHINAVTSPYPSISSCTFTGNSAVMGGAAWTQAGTPTFANCVFTGNQAIDSGGAAEGYSTFVNCTFARNSVTNNSGHGGAVSSFAPFRETLTLTACTFLRNTCAGAGGAVSAGNTSLVAVNCTFVANAAGQQGGALVGSVSGAPRFSNCTLSGNSAPVGGAMSVAGVPIANCIIWGNTANASPGIVDTSGTSVVSNSDVQGGYSGTGNVNADPLFVRDPSTGPDGTWGTPDDDYGDLRLQFNSPGVDAGNNVYVPAGVTADVAGQQRFFDFPGSHDPGAIVDMGAFELGMTLGVVRVADAQTVSLPAGHHTFLVERLSLGAGATLDVRDDALVLRGTDQASVQSLIRNASNNGDWRGQGMTSSTAANDLNGLTALGYASNANIGRTTFGGISGLVASDVLVKYTYYGDADLNGKVTLDDFTQFLTGYQASSAPTNTWLDGDFDYNAKVTLDDFTQFLAGYQRQGPQL